MLGKDGHNYPDRRGINNSQWRGGTQKTGNGYTQVVAFEHPNADLRGRILEHRLIAERVLGRVLPLGAEIHHLNGQKSDNTPSNLVICENHAYHMLLHRRQHALDACGHAGYLRCRHCREWDSPANLKVFERPKVGVDAYHKTCHTEAERKRLANKS